MWFLNVENLLSTELVLILLLDWLVMLLGYMPRILSVIFPIYRSSISIFLKSSIFIVNSGLFMMWRYCEPRWKINEDGHHSHFLVSVNFGNEFRHEKCWSRRYRFLGFWSVDERQTLCKQLVNDDRRFVPLYNNFLFANHILQNNIP